MDLVTQAFGDAIGLIVGRDPELLGIAGLSLAVSVSAALLAGVLGVPLGAALPPISRSAQRSRGASCPSGDRINADGQ